MSAAAEIRRIIGDVFPDATRDQRDAACDLLVNVTSRTTFDAVERVLRHFRRDLAHLSTGDSLNLSAMINGGD